ncbi:MAG: 4Fe-4S binding protein [Dehalococcoidia bacterium]|nr:4Fe-4S binding protein [Dehalococcoidia bacterium]
MAAEKNNTAGWNARSWLKLRTAVQIIFFLGFIVLFLGGVPLLMRLDPLAMLAGAIAGRSLQPYLVISLVIIVLALILGRAWCGWLCPMGTLLEWFSFNSWRSKKIKIADSWRSIKYIILLAIASAAILANLTLLIFDPMTIFVRTFSTAVWPALDFIINAVESVMNNVPALQEPLSRFDTAVRSSLLPADPLYYRDGLIFGGIFIALILLNFLAERFWCRYLCPLGAFYGLLSKVSIVRRRVNASCIKCKLCQDVCPTGTIKREKDCSSDPGECIMCLKCMDSCPCSTSDFGPVYKASKLNSYDPVRRQLLLGLGTGILLAVLLKLNIFSRHSQYLIRPPGSTEQDMTAKCIRCGECIKACPTGAIQPSQLEAGGETVWTPVLVMRSGFCQYSCNACGKTCPTAAIPELPLPRKKVTVIGRAFIDRDRCLPWAKNTPCIVCEEMCPVPHKAVRLSSVEVTKEDGSKIYLQRPTVQPGRCIGCGLCEYKCPVEGEAAIRVTV